MPLVNRNIRGGPDAVVTTRNIMAALCALIMFALIIFVSLAWPRLGTMFDRFYDTLAVTGPFNKKILSRAFYLLPPLGLFSIIGLALNSMRTRRKHDRWSITLILGLVVSIAGGIFYFLVR